MFNVLFDLELLYRPSFRRHLSPEESDRASRGLVWSPTKRLPILPEYYSWTGRDRLEVDRLGHRLGEVNLSLPRSSVVTGSTLRVGRGGDGRGEEEGESEEEGLEYATNTPSGGSYTTPPSTGGRSTPSPAPSCSPTPGDSDPENNAALCMEELEAHIEAFLEEAEEDLLMDDLPPAENTSLLPVPAPVFPDFVLFAVSTGQCCVPPKHLVKKVYHPYNDPVGRCCCEPGGWCDDLPCSGRK